MDRFLTSVSPRRSPLKVYKDSDHLIEALELSASAPILTPQSPTKLSPTKPVARVQLNDLWNYELSPAKVNLVNSNAERKRLTLKYSIDVPSIRDDFYSTLMAQSPLADELAVGVRSRIRLWNGQTGATSANIGPEDQTVMCMAYSRHGLLAVGCTEGIVFLYDPYIEVIVAYAQLTDNTSATCLAFSAMDRLYVGCVNGDLVWLKYHYNDRDRSSLRGESTSLTFLGSENAAKDIISGMQFNHNGTRLVVGSNDGNVTVWNTQDERHAMLLATLKHGAAVRAIAFFPTLKDTFITGGGRSDRMIRVWDICTKSLLYKFEVPSQVTGFVWLANFELFIALGHSRGRPMSIGQFYRFTNTKCELLFTLKEENEPCRAMHAVPTPNGFIVSTSSKKLYFYDWKDSKAVHGRPRFQANKLIPILR